MAHLLDHQFFEVADPSKGRFRSYLLASLKHFLADAADWAGRRKRGAGRPLLSLDAGLTEHRYTHEPTDPSTPEQLFEHR